MNQYKISTTDLEELKKTGEYFHCTDVMIMYGSLKDVWSWIGFKMYKKDSFGYYKIKDGYMYRVQRV